MEVNIILLAQNGCFAVCVASFACVLLVRTLALYRFLFFSVE